MQDTLKSWALLGDTLNQFPCLETVVVESHHKLEEAPIQSLLGSLRKVCKANVEVQHRTCDEAHKIAVQAKEDSTIAGLLSPYWCQDMSHNGVTWCASILLEWRRF